MPFVNGVGTLDRLVEIMVGIGIFVPKNGNQGQGESSNVTYVRYGKHCQKQFQEPKGVENRMPETRLLLRISDIVICETAP